MVRTRDGAKVESVVKHGQRAYADALNSMQIRFDISTFPPRPETSTELYRARAHS